MKDILKVNVFYSLFLSSTYLYVYIVSYAMSFKWCIPSEPLVKFMEIDAIELYATTTVSTLIKYNTVDSRDAPPPRFQHGWHHIQAHLSKPLNALFFLFKNDLFTLRPGHITIAWI